MARWRHPKGVCQEAVLRDTGQRGLVLQDLMRAGRRAAPCSSHSCSGLSAAKGMGVAAFPVGIRSSKSVGLGKLKSLPYRKIFISVVCIVYESKTNLHKTQWANISCLKFGLGMVLPVGMSFMWRVQPAFFIPFRVGAAWGADFAAPSPVSQGCSLEQLMLGSEGTVQGHEIELDEQIEESGPRLPCSLRGGACMSA